MKCEACPLIRIMEKNLAAKKKLVRLLERDLVSKRSLLNINMN